MKIEKLRNNHKKEIIIGTILTAVIGGALTFRLTHSKYRVTQSIDLAEGVINYTVPDFKIMAMYKSEDGKNYSEITDRMPSTGYVINTSKSYCTLDNVNHDNEAKLYTYEGKHVFENLKKSEKCYLYFDKYVPTASETILANLGTNIKTTTPDFSKTATTDEGVYATSDGMYGGTTYYWRGAVTNNYVKFANKCWRIIRINGDKTIRMIYDGSTCHENGTYTANSIAVASQAYNSSDNQSYYVGWTYSSSQRTTSGTASNAKTQLQTWYNNNLNSYDSFIANGKYCNDRNTGEKPSSWSGTWSTSWSENGTQFAYAGLKRLYESYSPTFSCPSGDVYTLKVGLIIADEVSFAGGVVGTTNNLYYLHNGQNYWTMSPCYWDGSHAIGFYVYSNGNLHFNGGSVSWAGPGLRPVINLKSDTIFSSGNGTQNNPYVVS